MVSMSRSTHTERVGDYNSSAKAPGSRAYGEGEGYISSVGGWGGDGRGMGTFEGG